VTKTMPVERWIGPLEALEDLGRHADIGELVQASGAVQQAHDDGLSVLRRHGGNADVDLLISNFTLNRPSCGRRFSDMSSPTSA